MLAIAQQGEAHCAEPFTADQLNALSGSVIDVTGFNNNQATRREEYDKTLTYRKNAAALEVIREGPRRGGVKADRLVEYFIAVARIVISRTRYLFG